jgi:hypothetical protein
LDLLSINALLTLVTGSSFLTHLAHLIFLAVCLIYQQAQCSDLGVASPARGFTGLFFWQGVYTFLINKLGSLWALCADSLLCRF